MFTIPNEIIKNLEEEDFKVTVDGDFVTFNKMSSMGQDFSFTIEHENDIDQLGRNVEKYYENFDVSEEASLWLDETGHGKNGAPYDMKDVYKDMEECEEFINKVSCVISDYQKNYNVDEEEMEI